MHKASFDLSRLESGLRRKDAWWQQFSEAVSDAVIRTGSGAWQDVELAILNVVEQYYPRTARARGQALHISAEYWEKHRTMRRLKAQGQETLQEYIHLRAEIEDEIRQHKQVQRERRRAKQEELLLAANEDRQQQSHNLSRALQRLAPWQPPQKISLRDEQGGLLDEQSEARMMREYSEKVFCRSGGLLPVSQPQPVRATASSVQKHVSSIPLGKAVPRQAAPVAAWRSLDEQAAAKVADKLAEATSRANLDTHLKDPYVTWIPKPNKAPSKPEHLRPIGVLSVPAKILAGIVRESVSSTVQDKAQYSPQFAYLKKRGTREAILHAVKHLEEAQSLAEIGQRRGRLHGNHGRKVQIPGSIIISLDLSKAFDSVDRVALMQALDTLGVDDHTKQLVQQLHTDTTYHMTVSGVPIAVRVTSGIKQGCKLAPILWSALTLALLDSLADSQGLREQDVSRLITLFADDFLAKGHFRSEAELLTLLDHFSALFTLLKNLGLVTNPSKSQALIQIHGTQAQIIRALYIRKGAEGRELCISDAIRIPIRKNIVYLGVVLAFGNYRDLTVKHRLKQSKEKFRIVRQTLRSTRVLTVTQRISIWQRHVVSSMMYGLESTGVTELGLRLLGQRFSANIRYILGEHQIHRQLTTQQLIEQHAVHGPHQQLLDRMGGFLRGLEDSSPEASQPMKPELQRLLQDKFTQASSLQETWDDAAPREEGLIHSCQHCGGLFQTWSGLVRHHKARHGHVGKLRKGPKFNIRLDSCQGTASCSACKRQLASVIQLRAHVESGACPKLSLLFEARQAMADNAPVPKGPEALLQSVTCRAAFMQYCALCGQRIVGHKGIKQHIKQVHATAWESHSQALQDRMLPYKFSLSKGSACRFCAQKVDAPGRHALQCVVLLQAYFTALVQLDQVADERKAASNRAGSSGGSHHSTLALSISFANPHQLCYANSVWGLLLHCQAHTVRALNTLQRIWHALRSRAGQHIHLTTNAEIRGVSDTWSYQATQEDAGHYLQHILQSEEICLMEWEARVDLGFPAETLVEDRGRNLIMLNAPTQEESLDLQEMLAAWRDQAFVHGIAQCQELLFIQLPRYVHAHKDSRPCHIPAEVQAPHFTDLDRGTALHSYYLVGGLLHLGAEPRSGHYRHFIVEHGNVFLGDDFQNPEPAYLTSPLMTTNVYILAYIRSSL